MAQITIYIPDDIAEKARDLAARDKKSVSAFVSGLVAREVAPPTWPRALIDLLNEAGEHPLGDLQEPDDPPPEEVEGL